MNNYIYLFIVFVSLILSVISIILNMNNCKINILETYKKRKIYDCFMISTGEENILTLRLKLLDPYVTKFIIIDSDESHRGHPKKLINMNEVNISKNIKEKIIYENCKFPKTMHVDKGLDFNSDVSRQREAYQRNRIMHHLVHTVNANNDDICFVSDGDEIPFYDKILKLMKTDKINWIEMNTFVYNIHWYHHTYNPLVVFCAKFKYLRNKDLTKLRFSKNPDKKDNIIKQKDNTVIHLNRFGSPKGAIKKEAHMFESNFGEGQAIKEVALNIKPNEIRDYFEKVCNGKWENIVYKTDFDFPQLVYDILHPINSMDKTKLKQLEEKTKKMDDNSLINFTNNYFK